MNCCFSRFEIFHFYVAQRKGTRFPLDFVKKNGVYPHYNSSLISLTLVNLYNDCVVLQNKFQVEHKQIWKSELNHEDSLINCFFIKLIYLIRSQAQNLDIKVTRSLTPEHQVKQIGTIWRSTNLLRSMLKVNVRRN